MAPDFVPSVVVLDLHGDEKGLPVGSIKYVESEETGKKIRVRWPVESQPADFDPIAGGVAYIYNKEPKVREVPISDDARPTKIGGSRYQWSESVPHDHLMFILIMPPDYTLDNPDPKPAGTKNFKGRLALYWILEKVNLKPRVVEWDMEKSEQSLETEILRINRAYLTRKHVDSSTIAVEDMAKLKTNERILSWFPIAGVVFGAITLLFLMLLIVLSLFSREIPTTSRFILVAFLALSIGLSSTFLGGTAAAKGSIRLPFFKESPMSFAVTGGIAVFVIVLVLGYVLYVR